MQNLMFVAVLFLTVSGFGGVQYPECETRVNPSVKQLQVQEAAERLMRTAYSQSDQSELPAVLSKKTGTTNPQEIKSPVDYLAHAALSGNRTFLNDEVYGNCDRESARDKLVAAEGVVLELRRQLLNSITK